jgi:hypothetical protein
MEYFSNALPTKKLVIEFFFTVHNDFQLIDFVILPCNIQTWLYYSQARSKSVKSWGIVGSPSLPPLLAKIAPIFNQRKKLRSLLGNFHKDQSLKHIVEKTTVSAFKIPLYLYPKLVDILQIEEQGNHRYISELEQRVASSRNEVPVPSWAKSINSFKHLGLTYTTCARTGSSSVKYFLPSNKGHKLYGKIKNNLRWYYD